jgi:hypothetical protein
VIRGPGAAAARQQGLGARVLRVEPQLSHILERAWDDMCATLRLELIWYPATHRSFIGRLLEAGAARDEVSTAVAIPRPWWPNGTTTTLYFIRRSYS